MSDALQEKTNRLIENLNGVFQRIGIHTCVPAFEEFVAHVTEMEERLDGHDAERCAVIVPNASELADAHDRIYHD